MVDNSLFNPIEGYWDFNEEQISSLEAIKQSIKNGKNLTKEEIEAFSANISRKGNRIFGNGTRDKEKIQNYITGINLVSRREKDFENSQKTLNKIQEKEPTLYEKIQAIQENIGENLDPIELATGDISALTQKALEHMRNTDQYSKALQDLKKFKDENKLGFQIEDLLIFPAIYNAIKNHLNGTDKILKAKENALQSYESLNAKEGKILTKLGNKITSEGYSKSAENLLTTKKHLNDMKVKELYDNLSTLDKVNTPEVNTEVGSSRISGLTTSTRKSFTGLS